MICRYSANTPSVPFLLSSAITVPIKLLRGMGETAEVRLMESISVRFGESAKLPPLSKNEIIDQVACLRHIGAIVRFNRQIYHSMRFPISKHPLKSACKPSRTMAEPLLFSLQIQLRVWVGIVGNVISENSRGNQAIWYHSFGMSWRMEPFANSSPEHQIDQEMFRSFIRQRIFYRIFS